MNWTGLGCAFLLWAGAACGAELPTVLDAGTPAHRAAPPAPPIISRDVPPRTTLELLGLPGTAYSIGDPTDEEQLVLEYINRARADARAEATRLKNTTDPDVMFAYSYFGVDLDQMTNQFNALTPALGPYSFQSNLLEAARRHASDCFTNAFQGHYSSTNPPAPFTNNMSWAERMLAMGYEYSSVSENVYSYGNHAWHAHAGFEVDWGWGAPYGMQEPPNHRNNDHNSSWREVGLGVVQGYNTCNGNTVGPYIVVEDFGTRDGLTPYITGVVYYDFNSNRFYDVGEGVGGVGVVVSGASYHAVTAVSGGYSVPVPGAGVYEVTFSATNLADFATNVTVTGTENAKLDYRPAFMPATITGWASSAAARSNRFTFTGLGGATNYRVRVMALDTNDWFEGAENGANYCALEGTPGYEMIQTTLKQSGSYAFHLAHPTAVRQSVRLSPVFVPKAGAGISFQSRLGYATTSQFAGVQVSTDDILWSNLWTQAGSGSSGEDSFNARHVDLPAGPALQIRFAYKVSPGGWYYYQTNSGVGWYVDTITISNAERAVSVTERSAGNEGTFTFVPPSNGLYQLDIRGEYDRRTFPYGGTFRTVAGPAVTGLVRLTGLSLQSDKSVEIGFTVTGHVDRIQLEQAESPGSSYSHVSDFQPVPQWGTNYSMEAGTAGATPRIFRLRGTGL